jgi:hypothetical protein
MYVLPQNRIPALPANATLELAALFAAAKADEKEQYRRGIFSFVKMREAARLRWTPGPEQDQAQAEAFAADRKSLSAKMRAKDSRYAYVTALAELNG